MHYLKYLFNVMPLYLLMNSNSIINIYDVEFSGLEVYWYLYYFMVIMKN